MGTWDTSILGNDTSREVEEHFLARYDECESVETIVREIGERFATSLALPEDRTNVELALALVRWEVGALDPDTRARVQSFEVVGRFPRFTQVLLATTGADPLTEPDPNPALAALVARRHAMHLATSAEPLRVLAPLLSTRAPAR